MRLFSKLALILFFVSSSAGGQTVIGTTAGFPLPLDPIRFDDPSPLMITAKQPTEPRDPLSLEETPTLAVLNDTGEGVTLQIKLDGLEIQVADEDGNWKQRSGVFRLDAGAMCGPGSVTVPAAGTADVELALAGASPVGVKPGDYRGSVVMLYTTGGAAKVLRKEIVLSVANQPAMPLVKKWTIAYWRCWPSFFSKVITPRSREGAYLPLASAGSAGAAAKTRIGHLKSAEKDEVAVYSTVRAEKLESDYPGATIKLEGVDRFTAKYEGTVDFQPAVEGEGEVTLTVEIQDHWAWAVLCLLIGIGVTFLIQRSYRIGRPISLARERDLRLGIAFDDEAKGEFQKKAGSGPFAGFSIAAGLAAERKEVQDTLTQLLKDRPENLEEDDRFKATREKQERLEAAVASWPGFYDELTALDAALSQFQNTTGGLQPPVLQSAAGSPSCGRFAQQLLVAGPLSITEYENRRRQVADATAVLRAWPEVEQRVQIQIGTIAKLEPAIPKNTVDRQTFESAKGAVLAIWDRLWRLETTEELEQQATELDASRDQLARLSSYLSSPRGVRAMTGGSAHFIVTTQKARMPAASGLKEPQDDRELLAYYGNRRRRYEYLTLFVALVLAVYTGLNQLYQGHEFVTPWHYLGALLWGAGTKLTVDTVAAGVGSLPTLWKSFGRT